MSRKEYLRYTKAHMRERRKELLVENVEETLERVVDNIRKAFEGIDLDVMNCMILPHGRTSIFPFNSKEEYIEETIKRTKSRILSYQIDPKINPLIKKEEEE